MLHYTNSADNVAKVYHIVS